MRYDRYHRPVVARPPLESTSTDLKRFVYSVRLAPDEITRLNRLVHETGRTASDIFRAALTEYMERYS